MKIFNLLITVLFLTLVACSTNSKKTEVPLVQGPAPILQKPLDPNLVINKIALGSCSNQDKPAPIFETIVAAKPDFYLFAGDNVYASRPESQPIQLQYDKWTRHDGFRNLFENVPNLAIWDDHDYGFNDGGADNPKFDEARKAYMSFFPEDKRLIDPNTRGLEHATVIGPVGKRVQFILIDTRSYRGKLVPATKPGPGFEKYEPTKDKKAAFLGEDQWLWLETELKKPAELRFIVSSVQFLAEGHGYEKWGNFPQEQERLSKLLAKTKVKNTFILSGDRHIAEILSKKIKGYGKMYELTASALNMPSNIEKENEPTRLGNLYNKENFGTLEIDWKAKKLQMSIHDQQGAKVETQTVDLKL